MMRHARIPLSVAALLLITVSFALGAPSVSVVPSGATTYIVQGSGMDGVSGMDLTLSYTGTLSGPAVNQGGLISGGLLAANTNIPGSIRMSVISTKTFSGSGQIATITFASGAGSLTIASVNMINSNGTSMGATTDSGFFQTPGIPFSGTTTPPPAATGDTTGAPAILGTVSMPSDGSQPQATPKPTETAAAPPVQPPAQAPAEAAVPAADAKPAEQQTGAKAEEPRKSDEPRPATYIAVLERFRTYQGEKSPAILIALFSKPVAASISQEPGVVLSDGATHVRIIATLTSPADQSPNFALNGARLISLTKDDQAGSWTIEALPQANAVKASLTILNGNEVIEFPLTVAPPIKAAASSEADFAAFLKNSGKTADLNNDGVRDYIDDYIYTANYLARKKTAQPHSHHVPPKK